MSEAPTKAELRRRMREMRDALPEARRRAWSEAIADRVLGLPEVEGAASVFCYVSFRSEVETHELIRRLLAGGRAVHVPRTTAPGEMIAQRIGDLAELRPGPYGILAPPPVADAEDVHCDVAIVPGLAFTRAGDRLGYGAGHYDRWLERHFVTRTVALAFEAQIVEHVPTQPHDRRMDRVVTERA